MLAVAAEAEEEDLRRLERGWKRARGESVLTTRVLQEGEEGDSEGG